MKKTSCYSVTVMPVWICNPAAHNFTWNMNHSWEKARQIWIFFTTKKQYTVYNTYVLHPCHSKWSFINPTILLLLIHSLNKKHGISNSIKKFRPFWTACQYSVRATKGLCSRIHSAYRYAYYIVRSGVVRSGKRPVGVLINMYVLG